MIEIDSGSYLVLIFTKKMLADYTYKKIKESIETELFNYLMGYTDTITLEIISKYINEKRLIRLSSNIKKYIKEFNSPLKEEDVFQAYIDIKLLTKYIINLKLLKNFIKKCSNKKCLALLGARDLIKFDLEENYYYNVFYDKTECYLKWKRI